MRISSLYRQNIFSTWQTQNPESLLIRAHVILDLNPQIPRKLFMGNLHFLEFYPKIFYNMDHRIHKIDSRFNLNSCFDFSVALFSDQSKNWHHEKKRQFNQNIWLQPLRALLSFLPLSNEIAFISAGQLQLDCYTFLISCDNQCVDGMKLISRLVTALHWHQRLKTERTKIFK